MMTTTRTRTRTRTLELPLVVRVQSSSSSFLEDEDEDENEDVRIATCSLGPVLFLFFPAPLDAFRTPSSKDEGHNASGLQFPFVSLSSPPPFELDRIRSLR